MTRRALKASHTYQEVQQHLDHHPALRDVRQAGSHRTYTGPHGCVTVPCGHRGDVPKGTLRSIVRMATLAGLGLICIAIAASLLTWPM